MIVHLLRDNKDKDRINNKTKIKRERGLEVTLFQKPASHILVKASIVIDTEITSRYVEEKPCFSGAVAFNTYGAGKPLPQSRNERR